MYKICSVDLEIIAIQYLIPTDCANASPSRCANVALHNLRPLDGGEELMRGALLRV